MAHVVGRPARRSTGSPAAGAAAGTAVALVAALALLGVGLAFADRDRPVSERATVVLLGSGLLGLALLGAWVARELRPGALAVPAGGRLPVPAWHVGAALLALPLLVGGLWASPPALLAGLVVLGAALLALGLDLQRPRPVPDRPTVVAARRLSAFAARAPHEDAVGVVEHLGRDGYRVVVVAGDGAYGDVVLRGRGRAERAVRLAGLALGEAGDRDVGARVRTGPYEWRRMAGQQLSGGTPGR